MTSNSSENNQETEAEKIQNTDSSAFNSQELFELEKKILFLGLAHKYAARRWSTVYYWLGIPSAVLSSVSGISAFS